jgi:hypothetical protein
VESVEGMHKEKAELAQPHRLGATEDIRMTDVLYCTGQSVQATSRILRIFVADFRLSH